MRRPLFFVQAGAWEDILVTTVYGDKTEDSMSLLAPLSVNLLVPEGHHRCWRGWWRGRGVIRGLKRTI